MFCIIITVIYLMNLVINSSSLSILPKKVATDYILIIPKIILQAIIQ